MHEIRFPVVALFAVAVAGCTGAEAPPVDEGSGDPATAARPEKHARSRHEPATETQSKIKHLVVIVQENHSFDAYFGRYCAAETGSNPRCTEGPACCEAGPAREPGGSAPVPLDDAHNLAYDPSHSRACEAAEIHGGAMDRFVSGAAPEDGSKCGDTWNFSYATDEAVEGYHDLARRGALADRYFQPIVGASTANDMYFATARYLFDDNDFAPAAIGAGCSDEGEDLLMFPHRTIGDLLAAEGVPWRFYAEGYKVMADAEARGTCPEVPADCPAGSDGYPCLYAPGDNPFAFFPMLKDDPRYMSDLDVFYSDLERGELPAVSFLKPLGYKTEHPGSTISVGMELVTSIVDEVEASRLADETLVLVTWDEAGGYFDHVPPPADSEVDDQPYGPRVPLLAAGPFARVNTVSHVEMEHSSIVRFIEWNWLGGETGQLGARDGAVNGIGSLLDPAKTGFVVP